MQYEDGIHKELWLFKKICMVAKVIKGPKGTGAVIYMLILERFSEHCTIT